MALGSRLTPILMSLGVSRIAGFLLLLYFSSCLLFQQWLPAGESLIRQPDMWWPYVLNVAVAIIVYACLCEFSRPRLLIWQRVYWWRLGYILLTLGVYLLFIDSFGRAKSLIPLFHPYGIDPWLHRIETFIHLGVSPSQWWVAQVPASITRYFAYFYMPAWGFMMQGYLTWQLCKEPGIGRSQFISCYFSLWIIAGLVVATLLASVGPIYYAQFYNDAHSAGYEAMLRSLLHEPDAMSQQMYIDLRTMLLAFYQDATLTNMNAISAMPSLHTAIAFLMALHSRQYAPRMRFITYPFALFIFIGSFALGWHYVIDSYVSAVLVWAVWKLNARSLKAA